MSDERMSSSRYCTAALGWNRCALEPGHEGGHRTSTSDPYCAQWDSVPFADEIVRLRTRVAELEAELVQSDSAWTFLDITKRRAADLEATLEELNDTYTIRRRAHNAEAALADQLAEALRASDRELRLLVDWPIERPDQCVCKTCAALAAYDRARTPATPTEDQ